MTSPPSRAARGFRRLRPLAVLAAVVALATACGSGSGSGGSSGSQIVEAVAAVPGGLAFDAKPGGYEAFEYTQLTGATLIRNPYVQATDDPNAKTQDLYKFEGVLAESYDVSADGKTFTFHLRHNVKSQAGNPFTADDVLYSYERKWKTASIAPAISLPAITDPSTQLKKVDDYTVTWTVAQVGYGFPLLAVISKISGEIYDSTLLKQHATADDPYAVSWSNTNGNFGYGPYIMDSYQQGQQITYHANPNYPLGKPATDKIIQRVVPDAANRASLVRNGDVDVAVQLRPSDIADLSKQQKVTTFKTDTNNFLWAFMQTKTAPLDDVRVRQAFAKAVPYQQIIDQVYKGRANPVVGLLNPAAPNHIATGLDTQVYDPAGAKALLAQAGKTAPVPLTITLSNAVPDLQEAAVQIQSFAANAGFDIKLDVVPPAVFADRQNNKQFQVNLMRDMSVSYESPPYSLLLAFPQNNDKRNSTQWNDPAYYSAVNGGIAAGDALSPQAATFWNQAEMVWQTDKPMLQIAKAQPLMAFTNGVKGFVHRTDNVLDFSTMTKG